MKDIKDWWLNLAFREKQILFSGSIVVSLLLLYAIIWSPLVNKNKELRQRIERNYELSTWMQSANQRIETLEKTAQKNNHPAGSILGTMQNALKNSPLNSHASQLHQAENNAVQFHLQKVNFDQLIIWLTDLWKKQGLIISQMTVTPTGAPGEVTVDVVMK